MGRKNRIISPQSHGSKRISIDTIPPPQKHDQDKPSFSLKYMNYGSKYCISKCEKKDKSAIIDKLLRISQSTWIQIISKSRQGQGYEIITQNEFIAQLPPVVTPEVDVMVFRYSKAGRIAGFKDNEVYHIILVGNKLYKH
jgi:hypothetical protein